MSWSGVAMAFLAMVSVSLWTLRVALAARGRRLAGAVVAAIEAVVFTLAFSNLIANLGSWERIVGYAAGVAVGTVGGLAINDRLSPGAAVIEMIVPGDAEDLRLAFHSRGWPATTSTACGVNGQATMVLLVVHRNRTNDVVTVLQALTPHALWTIRDVTSVHGVPGMRTSVTV